MLVLLLCAASILSATRGYKIEYVGNGVIQSIYPINANKQQYTFSIIVPESLNTSDSRVNVTMLLTNGTKVTKTEELGYVLSQNVTGGDNITVYMSTFTMNANEDSFGIKSSSVEYLFTGESGVIDDRIVDFHDFDAVLKCNSYLTGSGCQPHLMSRENNVECTVSSLNNDLVYKSAGCTSRYYTPPTQPKTTGHGETGAMIGIIVAVVFCIVVGVALVYYLHDTKTSPKKKQKQ